ncbi:hypothetical protein AC579_2324 [Pseudocercospora musae]|uniref:Cytochrome P450 n=1 Tax=Pseudocercospora musae TaxID=113226 RepID=A0A139I7T2_9PEZI|nr:hypothetical protein AC579_2324 [Pseudocercospora musae]
MAEAHWAGIAQDDLSSVSTSWITYFKANPTIALTLLLAITISITRLTSLTNSNSKTVNQDGLRTPPSVPYWLPILGHIPNMAIDADGFVKKLRSIYSNGIFVVNFGGSRHNIMYTPGLATALLNQKTSNADSEDVGSSLMVKVFGFPVKEMDKYHKGLADVTACYKHILVEPGLKHMVDCTAQLTKENINNLVTYMESPVDQMPWEKVANVDVIERNGQKMVEANLLELIRDFCAFTANPSIMGTDFLNNFPDFFDGIWTLDRGFLLLATGLPRWFPIPALTRAHIARKKNVEKCMIYHEQVEKWSKGEPTDTKWTSLDNIGSLEKARIQVYQKHNWSMRARAATEHALMWAANANSNTLVFWMINRIYADPFLLKKLRQEISPYITIVKDDSTSLPITSPPRISNIEVDGLVNNCPLLKSTYIECLRVDTASWSLKVVKQDFVLQSRDKEESQAWLLRKGDYAHAAHDLHNTDPKYWEDPMTFKADRHIKYDEDAKKEMVEMGSIRPYGGGASMCKGRAFALKESLLFTAAIISMWEIEPAGGHGKRWKIPKHRKATGVYGTNEVTRVWIERREV